MFSVMKTEIKFFPLCTKNVWPTKSGVTNERRDHVLIGFFAPALFILSIFSRRCDSTKGPFFNDLAINCKWFVIRDSQVTILTSRFLLRPSPFQNKTIARLVFATGFKSFGQLSPWTDRMMPASAAFRFSLAASHRMVDRVHRHATHMRATSLPTSPPCFTARYIHVIDVSHLADRGEALFVNATDFFRVHLHQRVTAFEVI